MLVFPYLHPPRSSRRRRSGGEGADAFNDFCGSGLLADYFEIGGYPRRFDRRRNKPTVSPSLRLCFRCNGPRLERSAGHAEPSSTPTPPPLFPNPKRGGAKEYCTTSSSSSSSSSSSPPCCCSPSLPHQPERKRACKASKPDPASKMPRREEERAERRARFIARQEQQGFAGAATAEDENEERKAVGGPGSPSSSGRFARPRSAPMARKGPMETLKELKMAEKLALYRRRNLYQSHALRIRRSVGCCGCGGWPFCFLPPSLLSLSLLLWNQTNHADAPAHCRRRWTRENKTLPSVRSRRRPRRTIATLVGKRWTAGGCRVPRGFAHRDRRRYRRPPPTRRRPPRNRQRQIWMNGPRSCCSRRGGGRLSGTTITRT